LVAEITRNTLKSAGRALAHIVRHTHFMPASLSRMMRGALALSSALVLAACAGDATDEQADDAEGAFSGTPNTDIGQLFMIEHFGVEPRGYPDVHAMIRSKNLGALILWNPTQASGEVVRQMAQNYASTAGNTELFIAADQEERSTQRFKSRNGFTDLVDAATLGRVIARDGNTKVCELHGRITAREMAASGMNMSLGTVSDLFTRDSGTPGMFRTRAIGADANVVGSCIRAMTKAYAEERHVVFITKHFPGLGNASGNTDVDKSVRSYSTTKEKMEAELAPYRGATAEVNGSNSWPLFGAMISHASYEILDKSKVPATLSPAILEEVVRSPASTQVAKGVDKNGQPASFAGMDLKGLTVSDAFWTWGAVRELPANERRRVMAQSFLAGMDILMISKADFNGAWAYFQQLNAGELPQSEQAELMRLTGINDGETLALKFRARVQESAARIRASKEKVGTLHSYIGRGEPRAATTEIAAEYRRLTQ
jgi:beta-glucosidase-like glycosyl hydrolase